MAMGAACILFTMASCKGRTQENMTPNGDTVELDGQEVIDGGEVVMNPSTTDTTVIADSPADEGAISTLLKLYPIAVLGYGLCAWLCRRDRLYLSWLLVVLSLLSSAAMLYLT